MSASFAIALPPPVAHSVSTSLQPISSSTDSREQSPPPKKRRRHHTSASDSEPDIITGHVLASGKFKCSDPECIDLKFGRQADFRRHYINVHQMTKDEYFCTWKGCDRSKRPLKKGKGRSFGSRRDKMEEHVRTIHERVDKKKNAPSSEDEERGDDDIEEAVQPQRKTQRHL